MESVNNTVDVEIILMQHKFVLRCTKDEEVNLRQAAKVLGDNMQKIKTSSNALSFEKLLLLSSIQMGVELIETQGLLQQVEQGINTLNQNIDNSIIHSNSL